MLYATRFCQWLGTHAQLCPCSCCLCFCRPLHVVQKILQEGNKWDMSDVQEALQEIGAEGEVRRCLPLSFSLRFFFCVLPCGHHLQRVFFLFFLFLFVFNTLVHPFTTHFLDLARCHANRYNVQGAGAEGDIAYDPIYDDTRFGFGDDFIEKTLGQMKGGVKPKPELDLDNVMFSCGEIDGEADC